MHRTIIRSMALFIGLSLASATAFAQFKVLESFTGATAPGWTLSGDAALTAPGIDAAGSGWLRVTANSNDSNGTARFTGNSFAGAQPIAARFRYVSWGGSGADGLTFFLYDAAQDMSGAREGGSLGYCGGAGGYLAVGLDEWGNFSSNDSAIGNLCAAAGGGPGNQPDRFVIRGPLTANNVFVASAAVGGGIDLPSVATRPVARVVTISLVPAVPGPGYTITARYQDSPSGAVQTLLSNVAFPYAPPPTLSVGFSGSTGGLTNFHEIQSLSIATANDVGVTITGPASVVDGSSASYDVVVTNIGPAALSGTNAPTVTTNFPSLFTGLTWTCSGTAGASCPASGSGNINTAALTLPVGGSVTFRVTGTAAAVAPCSSATVQPAAAVDFSDAALFLDPDLANNTAQTSTLLQCADTTPNAFSFTPVTGVAPSSVQTSNSITVSGTDSPAPISIVGGEYSINGGPFTSAAGTVPPGATVVVRQTASPNLNTTTTATLTIGGVSAPFAVTTRVANPGVLQFSAPTYTGSGSNPSITVTVTRTGGTDGAVTANVVDAQGNVVGTVSFADGAGGNQDVVIPLTNAAGGATLQIRIVPVTGGATVGAIGNATVTITAAPLAGVVIKSRDGGGAMSPFALFVLALVLAWHVLRRYRRVATASALVLLVGLTVHSPAQADEASADRKDRREKLYYGLRAGYSFGEISNSKVTQRLQSLGYNVTADVDKDQPAGAVYLGYEWRRQWAIEASYAYMGRTYTNLAGTTPANFDQFIQDALDTTEGAGEAIGLSLRYQWEWSPRMGVDFRVGGYQYKNRQTICIDNDRRFTRVDRGGGEMFGITPRYRWRENIDVGLSVDYFRSTGISRFWHGALTIEYHPNIDD